MADPQLPARRRGTFYLGNRSATSSEPARLTRAERASERLRARLDGWPGTRTAGGGRSPRSASPASGSATGNS